MNDKVILAVIMLIVFGIMVADVLICEEITTVEKYDVIEFDLGMEYFVYADDNGEIIRVHYWKCNSIMESNETYVNKLTFSNGHFINIVDYELYINTECD